MCYNGIGPKRLNVVFNWLCKRKLSVFRNKFTCAISVCCCIFSVVVLFAVRNMLHVYVAPTSLENGGKHDQILTLHLLDLLLICNMAYWLSFYWTLNLTINVSAFAHQIWFLHYATLLLFFFSMTLSFNNLWRSALSRYHAVDNVSLNRITHTLLLGSWALHNLQNDFRYDTCTDLFDKACR